MRKFGFGHRVLALLLVLIMTVQLLPLGALADAFGALKGADAGVDLTGDSAVGMNNSINWPIKVYDYLNDGMLFEWNDTNTSGNIVDSHHTVNNYSDNDGDGDYDKWVTTQVAVPYAGGKKPPLTQMGTDFTYDTRLNSYVKQYRYTYALKYTAWSSAYGDNWPNDSYASHDTFVYSTEDGGSYVYTIPSPYYNWNTKGYGKLYKMQKVAANDYATPMHAHFTTGTGINKNQNLAYFPEGQSTAGNARYMVLAYRSKNIPYVEVSMSANTSTLNRTKRMAWDNSAGWTYKVFDMKELLGTKTGMMYAWISFLTNTSTYGIASGGYFDITHVGFFATEAEANNYGDTCVAFDNDPGEYLRKNVSNSDGSMTNTVTTVTLPKKSDYSLEDRIFSLSYHWKAEGDNANRILVAGDEENVRYGMDFTTHSMENGWKTNAYTSDTYRTWSNGTTEFFKYTNDATGQTDSHRFTMDRIGVQEMTQSNGAQFVRLTTSGPSKIILSKLREDEESAPIGHATHVVLVYRANNLGDNTAYGLFAQGRDNAVEGRWKYAGLTKDKDWTQASNVNPQYFSGGSGWQYVVLNIDEIIGNKDSDMDAVTRLERVGMYLPTLTDGRSLDLAYVAYFKPSEEAVAQEFGQAAVNYMNSSASSSSTSANYGYGTSRVWYGGGNKSFGMLYSSGGGQYWSSGNSGSASSGAVNTYGYGFDTWMIGYRTNAYSDNAFNSARYLLVYNESTGKYDKVKDGLAAYTTTSSTAFKANASGLTNNIYFIATGYGTGNGGSTNNSNDPFDTKDMVFDGYQILESIAAGVMTAGLLEGSLQTVTVDGVKYRVPVYRQETVEYIAYNLINGLRVPMKDSSGNYNTKHIAGTASTQYGGVDLNGDGKIGWINYDGDNRSGHYDSNGQWVAAEELNEASVDLATALRHELGITFRVDRSVGLVDGTMDHSARMGNYADTLAKSQMLYGEFSDARNAIDTAMDAAYYLLNNLFISNSYNQRQDDYDYLTLSSATVNGGKHNDKTAYVFDAGFTSGTSAAKDVAISDAAGNKNAVTYSPYGMKDANGNVIGNGTISLQGVTGKTLFNYSTGGGANYTTRFPFLPITDAEGDYAGQTNSYYFLDDAQRNYTEGSNSYNDRNFNYAIVSNGEFVYQEEDGLFFQFEGDDDVYLFINGELVLDIGGAHSITSVDIDINTYVAAAEAALKDLEAYGYQKDMSIDQFDEWISAENIQRLDENLEPTGETVANPYFGTAKIAEFKRWHRLNLSDGQICQFDFYYMERHGWGANMRILTNMQVNDPNITTEKKAYQNENEIEYGGVIDPTAAVEYNFVLKNTGTTKLYNLTFEDQILGITLDPTNGLTVNEELNGTNVLNKSGGYLQAKDLVAVVEGENDEGDMVTITVTFEEKDGDGGQTALKNFLTKLESDEGTSTGYDDSEITKAGSGLWVDASVTFKGMYYILTREQLKETKVENTVYVTATTKIDPASNGCRTLRDDAKHLLYTNGFPIHYQWAGHNIFMDTEHVLESAMSELQNENSQISLYEAFFNSVNGDVSKIYSQPCDKFGRVGKVDTSAYLTKKTNLNGRDGYLVHYDEPGIYVFYLLLYMKSGYDDENKWTSFASSGVSASDIKDGCYAILRSQVYVADVENSVYVLDYGLNSQSLDTNGELFKNDYLFGPYGTIRSKLMGVSAAEPTFSDPATNGTPLKTGVIFQAADLETNPQVMTEDGFFNVNLAIPSDGKNIAWDSIKGEYTLTGAGTVTVNATVPSDWDTPYLYYWYDDGTSGPGYPGSPMAKTEVSNEFKIDIPGDVTNIIINNGDAGKGNQTNDLKINAGVETNVVVTVTESNGIKEVNAEVSTIIGKFDLHVKKDGAWENLYLYYWNDAQKSNAPWPGQPITEVEGYEVEDNGYIKVTLPADTSYVILNNGGTDSATVEGVKDYKQTADIDIVNGQEVWVEAKTGEDDRLSTETGSDGGITEKYSFVSRYSLDAQGVYTLHTSVPASWGETIYVYAWNKVSGNKNHEWPGVPMTKGEYFWNAEISNEFESVIINNGSSQTVDLTVSPGLETWVMVDNVRNPEGKYTATINSGSMGASAGLNFTPRDFMDSDVNKLWLLLTVHSTNANPTTVADTQANLKNSAAEKAINIHNEVQMYKSITILPATVVYYEDDFAGIQYHTGGDNTFTYYGEGSGLMAQSIDQDQVYGQDAIYQDSANNLYSGNHLTAVDINSADAVATFTFTGTGFELISRTDAVAGGTTVAKVYKAKEDASGNYVKDTNEENVLVLNQFDHGNDGGSESIEQVPTIRVKDLEYGTYIVELSGVPSLVYCGGAITTTVTQAGTCLTGEIGTRECGNCGKDLGTVSKPAVGHVYNAVVTEPTCTKDGFTVYTCVCGEAYAADRIPATGHSYDGGVCTACGAADPDAETTETAKTLYLKPSSNWKEGNARFAANFYKVGGSVWVDLEPVDGTYYSCTVPDGYSKVIFCRMAPDTNNDWNNKWNQTADLNVPVAVFDCLTLTEGEWDQDTGTWDNYICLTSTHSDSNGTCTTCGKSAETAGAAKTLYFKPFAGWKNDARHAAYFFNSVNNTNEWVDLTAVDDTYYSCTVPGDYDKVIFCRMNPATSENNWDNKWNQTGNLTIPVGDTIDCFVLAENWDDVNGNWRSYASLNNIHVNVNVVLTAPTCSEPGLKATVCSVCALGTTAEMEVTAHQLANGVCKTCGYVDPAQCAHIYLDSTCVYCGSAEPTETCEHNYESAVTAPTCVNWGYTTHTCTKCGDSHIDNEIKPNGHSYKKNGTGTSVTYKCEVCGEIRLGSTHYEAVPDQTNPTRIYIDGIRIYQPLGPTNDAYISSGENGAEYVELRDLIIDGKAAVATLNGGYIEVSSGTTTWSENLAGGDFDPDDVNSYVGSYVESADDYLIKGPNNEVYMEGAVSNSAIAFYVKEKSGADNHELHIAARALDYAGFFGAGTSKMNVQLQLGIATEHGKAWLNLTQIFSGTEQYYAIPYTRCPVVNGNYQILLRAVNGDTDTPALVSYSSLKLVNMELAELDGIGQASVLEYFGGLLVKPTYYLITGDQNTDTDTELFEGMIFKDGELTVTFDEATTVAIRRDMRRGNDLEKLLYKGASALGNVTSATLTQGGTHMLTVPAGEVTFKLVQTKDGSLTLSYCAHSWDENAGETIVTATCTQTGVKRLTCTKGCGHTKDITTGKDSTNHSYSGGKCIRCGAQEPKYYLNGTINGENCTGNDYLFVDGKLVVTLTDETSIYLKGENGEVYYAAENITTDTASGTFVTGENYTGTMSLPENVKVTFTLKVNADGSLSLSYTVPCAHTWGNGTVTKPATCTQPGIHTQTCTKCGETYESEIPAAHKYDTVTRHCTVCGAADPETTHVIYFFNSNGWAQPYIYTWTTVDNKTTEYTGGWSNTPMTPVEGEVSLYSYAVPNDAVNVIFHDNGSNKTADLTFPADGKDMYSVRDDVWAKYGEKQDYYLFGWINGANYGVDTDAANMGEYKLVDGTLKVTFTEDSYVGIKTTGNFYWFMTNGYPGDTATSAVFYNNCTPGLQADKLKVPGGTEVTFTLVENPDGTLTLSYTAACAHNWGEGEITTAPSCTEFGARTYTCSLCGATKTEKIDPTGHNFVDGVCKNCSIEESEVGMLVYFKKPAEWGTPNIYSWDGNNAPQNGTWPGTAMTLVEGDIYCALLPSAATKVIFNDGTSQTADLDRPTGDENLYDSSTSTWSTYPAVASVLLLEEEVVDTDTPVNAVAVAEETYNMAAMDSYVLNLESMKDQLASTEVYGVLDDGDLDTDIPDTEEPEEPVIDLVGASLSFKDEIHYNIYFNLNNPDSVEIKEMGLITWTSEIDGTVDNAEYTATNAVLTSDGYKLRSQAIAAKNMGEKLYFKVYLKLADGSYIYSGLKHYSARTYATNLLNKDTTSDSMKSLCVALMNYGAAAQVAFGYKTDDLMNAGLTAEQQALANAYSSDMLADVIKADAAKTVALATNGGFAEKLPSVNFGGAFGINYNFTTSYTVDGDLKLYVWTEEQYNSVAEMTLENASQVITMKASSSNANAYTGRLTGISAKNMEDTVYVCGVYESNGVTYRTGVLAYSVAAYMESFAANGTGNDQALAQAAAVYGYYARVQLLGE